MGVTKRKSVNLFERTPSIIFGGYIAGDVLKTGLSAREIDAPDVEIAERSVVANGRTFCVGDDKKQLCWTSAGDGILDVGYVNICDTWGDIVDLMHYNGSILLVCEHTLARLKLDGSPENYRFSTYTFPLFEPIVNCSCVCGELALVMTETGLYAYDGNDFSRYPLPFEDYIISSSGLWCEGDKMYLACTESHTGVECVYFYDFGKKVGYFVDCPCECVVFGDDVMVKNNSTWYVLDEKYPIVECYYLSEQFGVRRKKTVTYVNIFGDYDTEVTITNGLCERNMMGLPRHRVGMMGDFFDVHIISSFETRVRISLEVGGDI